MGYGSTNGGTAPGGLTGGVPGSGTIAPGGGGLVPLFEKTKSVTYNAATSDQIYAVTLAPATSV